MNDRKRRRTDATVSSVPEAKMGRRTFILNLSGGALMLAAGSLLAGCGGGSNSAASIGNGGGGNGGGGSNSLFPATPPPAETFTANADGSANFVFPSQVAVAAVAGNHATGSYGPAEIAITAPAGTYAANAQVTITAQPISSLPANAGQVTLIPAGSRIVSPFVYTLTVPGGQILVGARPKVGLPPPPTQATISMAYDPTKFPAGASASAFPTYVQVALTDGQNFPFQPLGGTPDGSGNVTTSTDPSDVESDYTFALLGPTANPNGSLNATVVGAANSDNGNGPQPFQIGPTIGTVGSTTDTALNGGPAGTLTINGSNTSGLPSGALNFTLYASSVTPVAGTTNQVTYAGSYAIYQPGSTAIVSQGTFTANATFTTAYNANVTGTFTATSGITLYSPAAFTGTFTSQPGGINQQLTGTLTH